MRLADLDTNQMVLIAAMLVTLSLVAFFELRYMRSRRKGQQEKLDLPDRAHNAILTTKAIRETLARGGVRSPEADELLREAQSAVRERNFRVAIEMTDQAKTVMRSAKAKQTRQGDLSKLETMTPKTKGNGDEVTAKERLMKELPANYAPSKFSINLARDEIASARSEGRDATEAEQLVAGAQASFDAQDYDAALKNAVRARRSLEAPPPTPRSPAVTPPSQAPSPSTAGAVRACSSCGVPLASDDSFCRNCGAKVPPPRTCPACAEAVADEDAFCRKCGAEVP